MYEFGIQHGEGKETNRWLHTWFPSGSCCRSLVKYPDEVILETRGSTVLPATCRDIWFRKEEC